MTKTTYADYKRHIRNLVAEYGRQGLLVGSAMVRFLPSQGTDPNEGGVVRATEPNLKFKDGAILRLQKEARMINGEIQLLRYSYHYERPNGYFFRYEHEDTSDPIRKPAYHMHVILNLPHFNAPPIDLEIMLKIIVANFYSPGVYSKQIIGQEIHLTV